MACEQRRLRRRCARDAQDDARAPRRAHLAACASRSGMARARRSAGTRDLTDERSGPVEQIESEAQRVTPPAQVPIAPPANALEERRRVWILRLLARVTLDRAAVFPFVFVPFIERGGRRVHRDETGVDADANITAVVEKLAFAAVEQSQVFRGRLLAPK